MKASIAAPRGEKGSQLGANAGADLQLRVFPRDRSTLVRPDLSALTKHAAVPALSLVRRLPIGAEPHPGGGIHFRVWAPRCREITIEIEGLDPVALQAERAGYFSLWSRPARAGMRYRFRLDQGERALPDPASEELRRRRHYPIPQQGQWLQQVVRGFFAYHAVPTNFAALVAFRRRVIEIWRRTLKRRSQRDKTTWQRIREIANAWLPKPKILHPWPSKQFAVKHPRWEPYAGKPHVRFCAGGAQ